MEKTLNQTNVYNSIDILFNFIKYIQKEIKILSITEINVSTLIIKYFYYIYIYNRHRFTVIIYNIYNCMTFLTIFQKKKKTHSHTHRTFSLN